MPVPQYVVRSYGGGAEAAQLIEEINAIQTTFSINNTVGWVENGGSNPLGTSGPFVAIIDRSTTSVEKILCSSVDETTGLVTVYTSSGFSGRGYDGTTAQAHVPNGSTAGVQTCWSAWEAEEANTAVNYLLGGTPTSGQVLAWNGTNPQYESVSGLQSVSLYGVDTAPVGSPPARLSGAFLMQAGTKSLTFVGGFAQLAFPQSFPNGFLSIQYAVESATGTIQTSWYSPSAGSVEIVLEIAGAVWSGAAFISYLAIGF